MKVYLDNNSTTPLSPEAAEEIRKAEVFFGNPSSNHSDGMAAKNILEESRVRTARALGAKPEEIIFTSGGTESNNLAVLGVLEKTDKKHLITTKIEHHSVLNVFKKLEKRGYKVSWIGVDADGMVDIEKLMNEVTRDTALVSIMLANNEVGTVQPVDRIAKQIKEISEDIIVHTDAVQAIGKMPLSMDNLGVDLLSVSGHKIYGPKGTGALYVRKGTGIKSVFSGGHQENNLRPGTENVQGAAGLGRAAEEAAEKLKENIEHYAKLKKRLKQGILESVKNVTVNGSDENTLPNTLNLSFNNIEGESVIMMLDMEGIAVSTGSACTSDSLEPSHVLRAMGADPASAQGSVRFSIGKQNTEEEIDYVIEKIPPIVENLRRMSPLEKG